jgi:ankyrin repeat protein
MHKHRMSYLFQMSLLSNSIAFRILSDEPPATASRIRIRKGRLIPSRDVFTAAASGDTSALDRMITAGANVNVSWEGFTPLMGAAMEGQRWAVKHLLEGRADPNRRHPTGTNALLLAIRSRDQECVRLLLAHKANPGPSRKGDLAPLHLAQLMGQELIIKMIKDALLLKRK